MSSAMHSVNFLYTEDEIIDLFLYAHEHALWEGGRYDANVHMISPYSIPWRETASEDESEPLGTFYFSGITYFYQWLGDSTPELSDIETEAGISLEDLMIELGQLELTALGYVKHGTQRR